MSQTNLGDTVNDLSREIASLLVSLAVLHAIAAPSIVSLGVLLAVATIGGVGFGYFRDSSYDLSIGVVIGVTYAGVFLLLGSLLFVDAVFCSFTSVRLHVVGCESVPAAYAGSALAVATGGFVGQLLYQR
jgi:hypothetical protein